MNPVRKTSNATLKHQIINNQNYRAAVKASTTLRSHVYSSNNQNDDKTTID